MKICKITYHNHFQKALKKTPWYILELFEEKQKLFQKDPFHPSLKTHKLSGTLSKQYSFSINYAYRVLFEFESRNSVIFLNIGTHSIYQ